jgi:hypothetical protein
MAQTVPPVTTLTALPTSVFGGVSFNQLGTPKEAGELGAIYAPSAQSAIGMYDSTTVDLVPVHLVDAATGRKYWSIEGTVRQGIHEKLFATGRWFFMAGGDVGPGLATSASGQGLALSLSGSLDVIPIYRVSNAISLALPIRLEYLDAANQVAGSSRWNPVVQFNVVFHLGALPAPKK